MHQENSFEEILVNFTLQFSIDDLSSNAITAAKMRTLDSIGVAMAAYNAPPVIIASRLAQITEGFETTIIWGTGIQTSLEDAAFVNGIMVRYLDLNDAWRTLDAHHPSDYLAGILGVAAAYGKSGKDYIEVLAIAYEIMCRFTDTIPFNKYGWDQPVSGVIATSLATGRLMGLNKNQMLNAVSLAVIPNLCTYQTRAGELSMWKGCAGPNGARNGIFASRLAREGMTGPNQPFDGIFGIWNQALGGGKYTLNFPKEKRDWVWGIEQTNIKTHAVRDSCQLPIFTALDLKQKINTNIIESLLIETYQSAWEGAVKDQELWNPKTRETADHSMLFSVACGLIDGEVTPDSFENNRFLDKDITDLIKKTKVSVLDRFTNATPDERNCRITATLKSGDVIESHLIVTLEEIKNGMSVNDIEKKFRECSRHVYDEGKQTEIIKMVNSIDKMKSVKELLKLIEI